MKRFSGRKKVFEEFKKLNSINEYCSDTSNNNLDIFCVRNKTDFSDPEEAEDEIEVRDIEESEEDEFKGEDSGSGYESPIKSHKSGKQLRIRSDSKSDSQIEKRDKKRHCSRQY